MSRKSDYSKYHSFIENGQKWLQCCRCMKHIKVDTNTTKEQLELKALKSDIAYKWLKTG